MFNLFLLQIHLITREIESNDLLDRFDNKREKVRERQRKKIMDTLSDGIVKKWTVIDLIGPAQKEKKICSIVAGL